MSKYELYTLHQADPVYVGLTFYDTGSVDEWTNRQLYAAWYFCQLDPTDDFNQYSELNGPHPSMWHAMQEMSKHFESYSMKGI